MSVEQQQIAQLDRQINRKGQAVKLGAPGGDPAAMKTLKAFVRGYKPSELVGGILQGDSLVTVSPTHLAASGFGPIANASRIFVGGRMRRVQVADPVFTNDVIVRWNLWVQG